MSDRGFTGHKHNDYIKLVDMRARWYAPEIGRFISPDPIVPDPANPQSFNRYSYVENNPLNFVDPTGHNGQGVFTSGTGGGFSEKLLAEWKLVKNDMSLRDFLVGRYSYQQYTSNPEDYVHDWLVRAGLEEGDWLKSAQAASLAEAYSENVLGEMYLPFFNNELIWEVAENKLAQGDSSGQPLMAIVAVLATGGDDDPYGIKLNRSLASQQQMSEMEKAFAGTPNTKPFRDASRVANTYGGAPED